MTAGHDTAAARLAILSDHVEAELARGLEQPDGAAGRFGADRLLGSMRYSLCAPGKRLRPLLLLTTAEAVGAAFEPLLRFACGIEMIHAYSLIHDDLPAMDDDELRRGRPTNHVVYGEGIAILAGDALLTHAFVAMSEPPARAAPAVSAELQLRVVGEVARAAGHGGMVGGQAADLLAEGERAREDLLRSIHVRKTGALIQACVRAGALLGGASAMQVEALERFSRHYGLAFQIADDIKDEVAPPEVTGKHRGGDRDAVKMTYPALLGVEEARTSCTRELDTALAAFESFTGDAATLEHLARASVEPAVSGRWS